MRQIAVRNRVALTGFGADPALSCLLSVHFLDLLKKRQLGPRDGWSDAISDGRRKVFAAVPSHALAAMVCFQESSGPIIRDG